MIDGTGVFYPKRAGHGAIVAQERINCNEIDLTLMFHLDHFQGKPLSPFHAGDEDILNAAVAEFGPLPGARTWRPRSCTIHMPRTSLAPSQVIPMGKVDWPY